MLRLCTRPTKLCPCCGAVPPHPTGGLPPRRSASRCRLCAPRQLYRCSLAVAGRPIPSAHQSASAHPALARSALHVSPSSPRSPPAPSAPVPRAGSAARAPALSPAGPSGAPSLPFGRSLPLDAVPAPIARIVGSVAPRQSITAPPAWAVPGCLLSIRSLVSLLPVLRHSPGNIAPLPLLE